ncbi:unnamed protein product [Blepharisma stoltei]|uniref:Conserved oligomeric Golgi complex subunit 3 n=1 Tax=Blepharisma stoltei TaxID=1481888 RepID=A0AAU9JGC8_9CILI|nr:unnamed protein product [Blepharisma stoltei]
MGYEEWEKYAILTKSARQLIQKEEYIPEIAEPVKPEEPPAWSALVLAELERYKGESENSYKASLNMLSILEQLNIVREKMLAQSKKLNSECSNLLKEREYLVKLNSELHSKHFYYLHLESLENQIELLANDPVTSRKKFLEILAQIEDGISFFNENPHYFERDDYLRLYKDLQVHWVDKFANSCAEQLHLFYSQADNFYKKVPNFEEIEAIIQHLKSKIDPENIYGSLIENIQTAYFRIRSRHLQKAIKKKQNELTNIPQSIVDHIRVICEIIKTAWKKEKDLFISYFTAEKSEESLKPIKQQMNSLCVGLYESCREKMIQEQSVDILCELALMMKRDFIKEDLSILVRIYQDIQERLIYSVQLYINESIVPLRSNDEKHPALKITTNLLSKLVIGVENEIFQGLAQEAVSLCLSALKKSMPQDDFIDGHAFLIKHILLLRKEILAMSEINCYTVKELDFSDTKRLFWKLIMGEVSLQKEGVLAEIVNSGAPKFMESNLDVRKILENELKEACKSFVVKVFHEIANPIIIFIIRGKNSPILPYEEAEAALMESSNRIMGIYPSFNNALRSVLDEKNYKEVLNSATLQIMKAFRQLISYMETHYIGRPLPNLIHIQTLLQSN